ncbi:MAG: hypothetical protein NTZ26_05480 [Candidatus Aminicenantes bacterium]|nr:hypothetical protein [Candidatus Aminicenantes bacterium]
MNKARAVALFGIIALLAGFAPVWAQQTDASTDEIKRSAPKVFLDGQRLDVNYIVNEIQFVNYVRDRTESDVHVIVTSQRTGGGGQEYTMTFIGRGAYEDLKNVLKFFSNRVDTPDEIRKGMVQVLKLGLAPYVGRTPISGLINMTLGRKVKSTAANDSWNFWVFNFGVRGRFQSEQARQTNSISGNISINRVTPQAKLRTGFTGNIDQSIFDYEDYQETSTADSRAFDGLYVFSLNDHWSVGGYLNLNHSSYGNINFGYTIHPAVEYNVFPYSESTRHQLRILYRAGFNHYNYIEETIYDKRAEGVFSQSLSATLDLTEPWGTASLSLEGANYFLKGFDYNHLRISGSLNFRLIKGLALTMDGRYSTTHDQIALRKGDVSIEELLLRRTELASEYSFYLSAGLSFTFGSVYSNVVNPRFGGDMGMGGGRGGGF